MIYEWKCMECGDITEVERLAAFYKQEPDDKCFSCGSVDWKKVITEPTAVPFETLKDQGQFPR